MSLKVIFLGHPVYMSRYNVQSIPERIVVLFTHNLESNHVKCECSRGGILQTYTVTDIRSSGSMNFKECYHFCKSQRETIRGISLNAWFYNSNTYGKCICHKTLGTFINKDYTDINNKYNLLPFGSTCSFESAPTCK